MWWRTSVHEIIGCPIPYSVYETESELPCPMGADMFYLQIIPFYHGHCQFHWFPHYNFIVSFHRLSKVSFPLTTTCMGDDVWCHQHVLLISMISVSWKCSGGATKFGIILPVGFCCWSRKRTWILCGIFFINWCEKRYCVCPASSLNNSWDHVIRHFKFYRLVPGMLNVYWYTVGIKHVRWTDK